MPKLNPELHREVQAYLDEMHATKTERAYVWRWVHDGHDFLSNGWYYAFEGGILMDIVSALRFDDELAEWVQAMSLEEFEKQFGEKELNGPSLEKTPATMGRRNPMSVV